MGGGPHFSSGQPATAAAPRRCPAQFSDLWNPKQQQHQQQEWQRQQRQRQQQQRRELHSSGGSSPLPSPCMVLLNPSCASICSAANARLDRSSWHSRETMKSGGSRRRARRRSSACACAGRRGRGDERSAASVAAPTRAAAAEERRQVDVLWARAARRHGGAGGGGAPHLAVDVCGAADMPRRRTVLYQHRVDIAHSGLQTPKGARVHSSRSTLVRGPLQCWDACKAALRFVKRPHAPSVEGTCA